MEGFYSPVFPLWFIISACCAVLSLLISATLCLNPYRRVRSAALNDSVKSDDFVQAETPGISIVVHAEGDDYVIDDFLKHLLRQRYDNFEVIVVNDASAADTAMLAEKYEADKRVYFTFIPPGSQVLSRHKLALTIGIKAARNEIILTTTAHARPLSQDWLAGIAAQFNSDKRCGAVLATSEPDFSRMPFARLMHAVRSARWIAAALNGKPYRGSSYNLAFLKKLFFGNKGYSQGVLLEGGEDDLFVEAIAANHRIAVVPGRNTRVMMEWENSTLRLHKAELSRHRESGKYLGYHGTNYWRILWIMNTLIFIFAAAMTWFYPFWAGLAASLLIILIAAAVETVTLSRLTKALTDKNIPDLPDNSNSFDNSENLENPNPLN